MTVTVKIDIRERALWELVSSNNVLAPLSSLQNLTLGDIEICIGGETLLIIERKTIADLLQSVKDGRYREQKARMMAVYGPEHIMYLIEGEIYFDSTRVDSNKTLVGCVINTLVRDHIRVFPVKTIHDTCHFIEQIVTRMQNNPASYLVPSASSSTSTDAAQIASNYLGTAVRAVKKDNITPFSCFLAQLSQIPGLSVSKATALAEHLHVSCMRDMVAWMTTAGNPKLLEKTVPGIGPKLARAIYEHIATSKN